MLGLPHPIVQLAYVVNDPRAAAERMAKRYGAGPFFLIERIELSWGEHRGQPAKFLHSSAYGQWGELMMELVKPEDDGPSPFHDLYPDGGEGLHHAAMMVPSLADAYEACDTQGLAIAARAQTLTGTEFAFVDTTAELGHMLEIYEGSDSLRGFYAMVRAAADDWDGLNVIRSLG